MAELRTGILGFGRTGVSAARTLAGDGHAIVVWDDRPERRVAAAEAGFAVRKLTPPLSGIVASPGISPAHPQLLAAVRAGIRVQGDIDIFWRRVTRNPPALPPVVAVTGTNGKSSTVAMVAHLLDATGRRCAAGGNLGTPVLDLPHPWDGVYVLELSSFQLARSTEFCPRVSVLLNIGSDHLDWHGSRSAYVAAKERMLRAQGPDDVAVICVDDAEGKRLRKSLRDSPGAPRVVSVSTQERCPGGVWVDDGVLRDDLDADDQAIGPMDGVLGLVGEHNRQNAVAAWAAARIVGAKPADLGPALGSFRGLPHRLEWLDTIDGVDFFNDSKATNVAATAAALSCFRRVCWVAGGRGKNEDLNPLLSLAHRVDSGFFFGEDGPVMEAAFTARIPAFRFERMDAAVESAFGSARRRSPPPPVLLSPACASYDQFADFEARGVAFRQVVRSLARAEP